MCGDLRISLIIGHHDDDIGPFCCLNLDANDEQQHQGNRDAGMFHGSIPKRVLLVEAIVVNITSEQTAEHLALKPDGRTPLYLLTSICHLSTSYDIFPLNLSRV